MASVNEQIEKARTTAAQSRDAAAAISAHRLAELQRQSPKAVVQYWNDPQLTPEDQLKLFAWLRRWLPTRFPRRWHLRVSVPGAARWLLRRPARVALVTILLALSASAWWNTPQRHSRGVVTEDTQMAWQRGGTITLQQTLPPGSSVMVVGVENNTHWVLRAWWPGQGYVTALAPRTAIQLTP